MYLGNATTRGITANKHGVTVWWMTRSRLYLTVCAGWRGVGVIASRDGRLSGCSLGRQGYRRVVNGAWR